MLLTISFNDKIAAASYATPHCLARKSTAASPRPRPTLLNASNISSRDNPRAVFVCHASNIISSVALQSLHDEGDISIWNDCKATTRQMDSCDTGLSCGKQQSVALRRILATGFSVDSSVSHQFWGSIPAALPGRGERGGACRKQWDHNYENVTSSRRPRIYTALIDDLSQHNYGYDDNNHDNHINFSI